MLETEFGETTVDKRSAQIMTICECIDHCFAYAMWCEDFAPYLDPEDMIWGLDRAAELLSDATRLQSFLALRKLDDFFGGVKPKPGDLTAADFGIDGPTVLAEVGNTFLSKDDEREKINKGVAHLTEALSLDADSEVDLHVILKRSITCSHQAGSGASQTGYRPGGHLLARQNKRSDRARKKH